MLLNDSITLHILVQLLIAKRIRGIQLDNGRVPEEGGDLHGGIKDGLDDRGLLSFDDWDQVFSGM